jgi:protein-tyrosine phosphatase
VSQPELCVATICTGNICRSPMAEVVLKHLIAEDPDLDGHVNVTSAGTARWHVGSAMDSRARRALDRAGYPLDGSPGAYASREFLDSQDLVVVMTREHLDEVRSRVTNPNTELVLWRHLIDPSKDLDVADPYYGDEVEFDECLAVLTSGGESLRTLLRSRLATREGRVTRDDAQRE